VDNYERDNCEDNYERDIYTGTTNNYLCLKIN